MIQVSEVRAGVNENVTEQYNNIAILYRSKRCVHNRVMVNTNNGR